jgi:hypothetical protein
MTATRILRALLLLMLVACTDAPVATLHPVSRARTQQFQRIVTDLAAPEMEGRGAGTQGIQLARDYIVERFAAMGLEPGFGDLYTQGFDITTGVDATRQQLAIDGRELRPDEDFSVLGFSGNGMFHGNAVFVGYGIVDDGRRYDSYADLPDGALDGKVAIAFRYEPQDEKGVSLWTEQEHRWSRSASMLQKADWAAQRGATALLIVNPPSQETPLRDTRRTASSQAAAIPVLHVAPHVLAQLNLVDLQHRADAGEPATQTLGQTVAGEVILEQRRDEVFNVAGILPGSGPLKDEVIVVGAHYDHLGYGHFGSLATDEAIHPGADDNASGVAALIMLADRMASRRDGRTIVFLAFAGEERGLLGSSDYVKRLADTSHIAAMLNFDMVGRMEERTLYVFGVGSADAWEPMVERAVAGAGLKLKSDSSPLGSSDHATFTMREIPAVHLFTGIHLDYHRPGDTADKINAEGGVRVVDVSETMLRELRGGERLVFNPDAMHQPQMAHAGQGGAYLGVMPDYATISGNQGCGVSAVTPGGPAQAAGLKGGDMIVRWNDGKIGNVYDLTAAIGASEPGQTVTLAVERDGNVQLIDVTLGTR